MKIMDYDRSTPNRSDMAVYCLMLSIMVYVGRIHELIPGTGNLNVAKLAIGLTLLAFFAMPKTGKSGLLSNAPVKYILGIVLFIMLSIPFSVYASYSVKFFTQTYIKNLVFFFLAAAIVSSRDDLDKVELSIVLSVLALSLVTLLSNSEGRASASTTYDPNDMAFVLVTFLPLVYFRAAKASGPAKLILAGVIIIVLLACIKTVSRGGLVGLVIVGGIIIRKRGGGIGMSLMPVVVAAILFFAFAPQEYWDRMSTIMRPNADYNVTASAGRIEVWKRGLKMMATHPLGVGIGCFEIAEGRMHEGWGKWSSPHNSFIQIGAELGVGGLYMFVMLLVASLKIIKECREIDSGGALPKWLPDGLETSFYGYIATGFFLSQAYSALLFLLVAMAISARKIVDPKPDDTQVFFVNEV